MKIKVEEIAVKKAISWLEEAPSHTLHDHQLAEVVKYLLVEVDALKNRVRVLEGEPKSPFIGKVYGDVSDKLGNHRIVRMDNIKYVCQANLDLARKNIELDEGIITRVYIG